jgi:DNA-directed RNA polymerase subunit RPC12/RpoP
MSVRLICGCGKQFEAQRVSRYQRCPDCAARAKKLRQERWREKQTRQAAPIEVAIQRKVRTLIVVNDPLERGGFREGTEFIQEEWEQMVRHLTFTPGTLLMDGQKRLYEFRLGTLRS